jgi:hypothetical protein
MASQWRVACFVFQCHGMLVSSMVHYAGWYSNVLHKVRNFLFTCLCRLVCERRRSGDAKHVVLYVQLIMQSGYGKSMGRNASLALNGDLERLTHSPVVLLGRVSVEPPEIY